MTPSSKFPVILAACLALFGGGVLAQNMHTHGAPAASASKFSRAAGSLPLTVQGAVVVAVPPSLKDTAAYMTLTNTGSQPIRLVGFTTPVSGHNMLMTTVQSGGMMGMRMVPALTIPAKGKLVLRRDGDHLMLMGLKRPLKVGETLKLTLKADDGRTLSVGAVVKKY